MLHVVDASHHDPVGQIQAVRSVLADVPGADTVRELIVLSKADLADPIDVAALRSRYPDSVLVSAVSGEGIAELEERIDQLLPRPQILIDLTIPFSRGDLVSRIHDDGEILSESFTEEGTHVTAHITEEIAGMLQDAGLMNRE